MAVSRPFGVGETARIDRSRLGPLFPPAIRNAPRRRVVLMGTSGGKPMKFLIAFVSAVAVGALVGGTPVEAKGCLKGAVVGGVAGAGVDFGR